MAAAPPSCSIAVEARLGRHYIEVLVQAVWTPQRIVSDLLGPLQLVEVCTTASNCRARLAPMK